MLAALITVGTVEGPVVIQPHDASDVRCGPCGRTSEANSLSVASAPIPACGTGPDSSARQSVGDRSGSTRSLASHSSSAAPSCSKVSANRPISGRGVVTSRGYPWVTTISTPLSATLRPTPASGYAELPAAYQ